MRNDLELPIVLDRDDPAGLRRQIVDQLRAAIHAGVMQPDDPLPSSRTLAQRLGVARATVTSCYQQLEGEGWLRSQHGAGTFVAALAGEIDTALPPAPGRSASVSALDLRPGDIDARLIRSASWRTGWRQVTPSVSAGDAAGLPQLRHRLATYLGTSRGLRSDPEQIIICSSAAEALLVLAIGLGWSGRHVGLEDPGYPPFRRLLLQLHVPVVRLDVSNPDTVLERLTSLRDTVAAVLLTPSHQYPLGHRLSLGQRQQLLAWARRTGTLIVEDDYDGEFRYDVPPLQSLAGIDTSGSVVYLGTTSKVLDPGLRIAYLRVPSALLPRITKIRDTLGPTVSTPAQQLLAELLGGGELARHIARVRRIYADRRRATLQLLGALPAVTQVRGTDAGLHVVADLAATIRTHNVVTRARARGLLLADLNEFRFVPDPASPALVIGYGVHTPEEIRRAFAVLAECLA